MRVVLLRRSKQLLLVLLLVFGLWLGVIVMNEKLPSHHVNIVYNEKTYDSFQTNSVTDKYLPEKSITILETEQTQRKKLAKEVCTLSQTSPNLDSVIKDRGLLDHIIVDEEHRLLYCYVPKVACTNWKRLLMVLMGKANTTNPLAIVADDSHRLNVFRRLDNYTGEEIRYRLEHFMKFMFIRHPFERLVSAFRNKFGQNSSSSDYFRSRYGRQIVKQYRTNASEESLSRGHDVTFREFVQYIIDPRTVARASFNEHWRPMVDLCLPCTIQYNVIGKYESLMDDAWLVLEKANLNQKVSFPRSERPSSTNSLVEEYTKHLSQEELLHLYHIYEMDFRLFDYHSPGFD
uniref:Carbohydrate sulfotransferase n=1 Tax=Daphnia hispanica TaxID=575233 RepID=A0A4Y7M423_9CRUS|nr:EOG090X0C3N [Daphnia hispanica]